MDTMLSFVVPAHNEQAVIGRTVQAIHDSAKTTGLPYEIIVVDDASTDHTAEIAQAAGAEIVSVNHRQIAATRNSGARAALGGRIFFVDADTTVNPRVIQAALQRMDKGDVGGGAAPSFDLPLPLYARIILPIAAFLSWLADACGGAFLYCTRAAFEKSGGFNEKMFCGEENGFILALKRQGTFLVIWPKVMTSGRRLRTMSGLRVIAMILRIGRSPIKGVTQRSVVQDVWYDSNRTQDDVLPTSLGARISNGIMLVIILLGLTGPMWNFIPLSVTPWNRPLGWFRFGDGFLLTHMGLAIFWPASAFFMWSLLRCAGWWGRVKTAGILAVCLWQAIDSTKGVIWCWNAIWHWLK